MTAPIIVSADQDCWGSRNEDFLPPRQHPYGNGFSEYAGRIRAICGADVFARVRGVSGISARNPGRHTPILFQSALTPRADTGGLRGILLPAFRSRSQFFPALKASGSLPIPLRVEPAKQSRGGFTNGLRSFVSSCSHAWIRTHGVPLWKAKVFPNLTKVLAKVK